VIDALDECVSTQSCGSTQSRPDILKALTSAATNTPWLKILITSGPEGNIQHCFNTLGPSMHFHCGLNADKETSADLAFFAKDRFRRVVGKRGRSQNAFDSTDKSLYLPMALIAFRLLNEQRIRLLRSTLCDSIFPDRRD